MDKTLIDAVKQMAEGKEEGFNKVYSETYNHVYFRAKSYMKNEEDALDLVQIVYVEAYRSISSLQNPEALYGWLDGITYRQGMKQYRKKRDVLLAEDGEGIFETLETEDISSMPELTTDQKETGKIIRELIEELPVLQKIAMIAYYFDNLSVGQIAEIQECSEGTVKSRLNYGRKYLKDRIEEKEKKEGYRLHVFTLPILYFAIKMLAEETTMTVRAAQGVYNASCATLGFSAGAITVSSGMASAATVSTQVAAAAEVGKAVGLGAKFASLSVGLKATVIAGALVVGTAATGGIVHIATKQPVAEEVVTEAQGNSVQENENPADMPGDTPEVNVIEVETIALSETEKMQIVDAIAYFGCMPYQLEADGYVATARGYIQIMLNGDGVSALPCGWTSNVVTEETVKAFYEDGFGITIPEDYAYNDYGITCNSELIWDAGLDYFKYQSMEISANEDGTYTLTGSFTWGAEGEEDVYSFEATAEESGNQEVFGGLRITSYTVNE